MSAETSILIVDDQPFILDALAQVLQAAGYAVFTASDGIEALRILAKQPIDLILSDISMPRMNGYQLCKYVRSRTRWSTTHFLFLTIFDVEYEMCRDQAIKADAYLVKPIQPEELLHTIQDVLHTPRAA